MQMTQCRQQAQKKKVLNMVLKENEKKALINCKKKISMAVI